MIKIYHSLKHIIKPNLREFIITIFFNHACNYKRTFLSIHFFSFFFKLIFSFKVSHEECKFDRAVHFFFSFPSIISILMSFTIQVLIKISVFTCVWRETWEKKSFESILLRSCCCWFLFTGFLISEMMRFRFCFYRCQDHFLYRYKILIE